MMVGTEQGDEASASGLAPPAQPCSLEVAAQASPPSSSNRHSLEVVVVAGGVGLDSKRWWRGAGEQPWAAGLGPTQ